ncbi:MAG: nucleotide exchange factor GrpE [Gemmatimonadetes bacterium]|nr:nucleotide exchange factor GrpE [Gemmatimonadota bacterium]
MMTDPNRTPDIELDASTESAAPDDGTAADAVVDDTLGDEALPTDAASAALAEAGRQLVEQKDKFVRLFAEFDNFRRRSAKERLEAESKGMGALIVGLLDSLDDLGRVAHFDPATTPAQSIVDGVALVEKKILKSLAGHGLVVVNPVGEKFDPSVQEALTAIPAALPEEDEIVAQVYQVGYTFNGQLLRPARVVVKQWHG